MTLPAYVSDAIAKRNSDQGTTGQSGMPSYVKDAIAKRDSQAGPAGGISTVTTKPVGESSPYLDELSGKWKERGERVGTMLERRHGGEEGFYDKYKNITLKGPETAHQIAGEVAGGITDIAEPIIGRGIEATSEFLRENPAISEPLELATFPVSQIPKLLGTETAQKGMEVAGEAMQEFEEKYPDAAAHLRTMFNVSELGGGYMGGKAVAREGIDIASDVSTLGRKITAPKAKKGIQRAIARKVRTEVPDEKIHQILNPTKTEIAKHGGGVVDDAGKTLIPAKGFYKKTREGVFDWYDTKENFVFKKGDFGDEIAGKMPKNYVEGAEALSQTKKTIYQEMKRLRGGADIQISQKPLATKLLDKMDDFPADSKTAELLSQRADELVSGRNMTVDEVGNHIESLNASVKSHIANNAPAKSGQALLDDMELSHWRKVRNDSILNATGEDIAPYQAAYARQLALEEGIKKGLLATMKESKNSIVDTFSSFADAHLLAGLATGGKAQLILGGTAKFETMIKRMVSSPSYKFKKLIGSVERTKKFQDALEGPFKPKSYVGKKLTPKPKSIYSADQTKQIKQKYPNAKLNKKGEYVTMLGGKEFKVQP